MKKNERRFAGKNKMSDNKKMVNGKGSNASKSVKVIS